MHTVFCQHSTSLPEHLRHHVWSGNALAKSSAPSLASGHHALDTQLPDGGWPARALIEVLLAQAGQGEWRLLMPALVRVVKQGGTLILIGPPHPPFLPALQREGIPPERIIWVDPSSDAQRLWATEQALKAVCVTAVLTWLPQARPEQIRRLHSHASQHPGWLFALRPLSARHTASAAPLRLVLSQGDAPHPLQVDILKRKGPLLSSTLTLPVWHKGLAGLIPQVSHVALDGTDPRRQPALALH